MNNSNIPNNIKRLHSILGFDSKLHIVGGAVRDNIMYELPKDFDFATVLTPEQVIEKLEGTEFKICPIGIRRGTVAVIAEDGESFEVTTFRKKGKETQFSNTIEEDLSARDFTINAIAFDMNSNKIIDPFGGINDIKNKTVRCVGNPKERFEEDPHRIIRMCRFVAKLNFSLPFQEIHQARELSSLIKNIEPERICAELKKIFGSMSGPELKRCINQLDDVNFFKIWIPELVSCKKVTQNKFHSLDVFHHILGVVSGCKSFHAKIAALFHDIGKPLTKSIDEITGNIHFFGHEDKSAELAEEIMKRLKFSNDDIAIVKLLVAEHMRPIDCGHKGIRKTKKKLGKEFDLWLELKFADKVSGGTPIHILNSEFIPNWNNFQILIKEVEESEAINPTEKLAISGFDVMNIKKIKPGKEVGQIIDKVQDFIFEFPEKNNREDLISFIKGI